MISKEKENISRDNIFISRNNLISGNSFIPRNNISTFICIDIGKYY
jgi:hypothetical protein